jgi:chromosome segregation ATPase
LRLREEQTKDTRLKQVQEENKKLLESNQAFKAQLSQVEFDRHQVDKLTERVKQCNDKIINLEEQNSRLKAEIDDQANTISTLKALCSNLESLEEAYSQLQVEHSKLEKKLESMKNNAKKFSVIQEEHTALSLQNAQLRRKVENLENLAMSQSSQAQEAKESLNWEISQLRAALQATKVDRSKFDEMELELLKVQGENKKLTTVVESASKRVEDLEKEKTDLESEHEKLERSVDSYKVSVKQILDLERQKAELESANEKLTREKGQLSKEIAKLKGRAETKEQAVEESSLRISLLESQNEALVHQVDTLTAENNK